MIRAIVFLFLFAGHVQKTNAPFRERELERKQREDHTQQSAATQYMAAVVWLWLWLMLWLSLASSVY